jgi:hypothetical protein
MMPSVTPVAIGHKSSEVVDINQGDKLVVDTMQLAVVDTSKNIDDQRKKDRHKKTEQRKEYQRNWVKAKRACPQ